jgi:hypothetical protein
VPAYSAPSPLNRVTTIARLRRRSAPMAWRAVSARQFDQSAEDERQVTIKTRHGKREKAVARRVILSPALLITELAAWFAWKPRFVISAGRPLISPCPASMAGATALREVTGPNGLLVMFICNHCPYVKAVIERIVRDVAELKTLGIGAAAIMSNDASEYPEDSFDNMRLLSDRLAFPMPYLLDASQDIAKAYGAVCTPDFFGFNRNLELQYRGRLDESRKETAPDGVRRDLFEAMKHWLLPRNKARCSRFPAWVARSSGCSHE